MDGWMRRRYDISVITYCGQEELPVSQDARLNVGGYSISKLTQEQLSWVFEDTVG